MKVASIELEAFTTHDQATLHLPKTGAVLVQGPNGAGKSSFLEAVAFACFGKTIRGTDPWRAGVAGKLTVSLREPALRVVRGCTAKGTRKLALESAGESAPAYDTAKKAAEALAEVVPDFDLWKRTHVFTSADASQFSTATDAERKRLLERMLGLELLDKAAALAKLAQSDHRARLEASTSQLARFDREVQALLDHRATLQRHAALDVEPQAPDTVEDIEGLKRDLEAKQAALAAAQNESTLAQTDVDNAQQRVAMVTARIEAHRRTHPGRVPPTHCTACKQPLPGGDEGQALFAKKLASWQFDLEMLEADMPAAYQAKEREQAVLREVQRKLRDLTSQANSLHSGLQQASQAQAAWLTQHAAWRERQARLRADADKAYEQLVALQKQHAEDQAQHAELLQDVDLHAALVSLFGLRGLRSAVLAHALEGIEAQANRWMRLLMPGGFTLKLKSFSEKASGGVSETLSLEVVGAGGEGYKALSSGERRRVDLALLLALTSISAAAQGTEPGTLWLDEVFDALDAENGVGGVVHVIEELAKTRCVVVITHNRELADRVPAAVRVRLEGKVL